MSEQSRWIKGRSAYVTPAGTLCYLVNGRLLWRYRTSEQRKATDAAHRAQEKRHGEDADARPA